MIPECQPPHDAALTVVFPDFAVNGTGIPDVDFDVGESYAGHLPITSDPDGEDKLFFWFFPSTNPAAEKEILIWLNGGVSSILRALHALDSTLTVPSPDVHPLKVYCKRTARE